MSVVTLSGEPIAAAREPDAEVLRILREALARAERGEIVGVAVGMAFANNTTMYDYRTGPSAPGVWCKYQLHHVIEQMAHDYRVACRDDVDLRGPPPIPGDPA